MKPIELTYTNVEQSISQELVELFHWKSRSSIDGPQMASRFLLFSFNLRENEATTLKHTFYFYEVVTDAVSVLRSSKSDVTCKQVVVLTLTTRGTVDRRGFLFQFKNRPLVGVS